MMEDRERPSKSTVLCLAHPNMEAHGYGLRAGDLLIAINGKRFSGNSNEFAKRLLYASKPVSLTYVRNGKERTVVVRASSLGHWKSKEFDLPEVTYQKHNPLILRNWLIMSEDEESIYDMHPEETPIWALLLTPFWLAQMRLWTALAAWMVLLMTAIVLPASYCALIIPVSHFYFWRMSPIIFRVDRQKSGFELFGVLAAQNEKQLIKGLGNLVPELRYVYSRPGGEPKNVTDTVKV